VSTRALTSVAAAEYAYKWRYYDIPKRQVMSNAGDVSPLGRNDDNVGQRLEQARNNDADVMSGGRAFGFGVYLIVLNLVLLYILVKIWPEKIPLEGEEQVVRLLGSMLGFHLPLEARYLLIVAVVGALGSYIHLATSFADYVGNRQFYRSWEWWYILRPFIGMALAVIIYFVIRGGLIAGTSGTTNLSPYGLAAVAGMAGMFSKQATDKLREVFENFFRTETPPERRDALQSSEPSNTHEGPPAQGA